MIASASTPSPSETPTATDEPTSSSPPRNGRRRKEGERSRAQRAKEQLFPDTRVFNTSDAGYVPLPIVFRALLWRFETRKWMVLTAVMMRCTKEQVAWFTLSELCYDLGYGNKGKLRTHLNDLEDDGFLVHRVDGGTEYWCAVDPVAAVEGLLVKGKFPKDRVSEVNNLLEMLGRPPLNVASQEGA